MLAKRHRNGSWLGGFEATASILYALARSAVPVRKQLSHSLSYLLHRLDRGVTGSTALEAKTLKGAYALAAIPIDAMKDIRSRLASDCSSFLSHTHSDKEFARHLCADLSSRGIRVWFDEAEIRTGDSLIGRVSAAIDDMQYLIVVLSRESVKSRWVARELNTAISAELAGRETKVIPVLIEDYEVPPFLRDVAWADFRQSYNTGLASLLQMFEAGK